MAYHVTTDNRDTAVATVQDVHEMRDQILRHLDREFKGTHKRLDIVNGRLNELQATVEVHEFRLNEAEKSHTLLRSLYDALQVLLEQIHAKVRQRDGKERPPHTSRKTDTGSQPLRLRDLWIVMGTIAALSALFQFLQKVKF